MHEPAPYSGVLWRALIPLFDLPWSVSSAELGNVIRTNVTSAGVYDRRIKTAFLQSYYHRRRLTHHTRKLVRNDRETTADALAYILLTHELNAVADWDTRA